MQSLSKLLLRIAACAKESSCAFLKYIHRNFFWETCIIYIGVLSQIWTIAKRLCKQTIEIYKILHPFRIHFRNNKKQWIHDLVLPNSLDEWIGEDLKWEEIIQTASSSLKKKTLKSNNDDNAINLLQIHFSEFLDDNQFDIKPATIKDENKIKYETIPKIIKHEFQHIDSSAVDVYDDIGQPINRVTMHEDLLPNNCNSIDDIQRFMRCEQNLRLIDKHKLSLPLNNNQWKNVQKEIDRIIVTSQGRIAMKKFKKLWSITVNNPLSMN